MKRKPFTVIPAHQIAAVPTTRHLPLVDLLVDTRTELLELAVRSGMKVLECASSRRWRRRVRRTCLTWTSRMHSINYADDFVILSRGYAAEALAWTRWAMTHPG